MKNVGFLILCLLQFACTGQIAKKINGLSFVASQDEVTQVHVDDVLSVYANHTAVMPFGFIRTTNTPQIMFNTDRQWFGETRVGVRQYIEMLHKNQVAVMLKPQIWIRYGEFTGLLKMESEENWKALEDTYEKFITMYAELADETNTEIFCIGTELELFVKYRPDFWMGLIRNIKKIYKGKLTYAANWDEYTRTPFWDQLDFIGVDAYFPLSEERNPTISQLKQGWQKWKPTLKSLSKEKKKPILFTEFGYRSMDYTAKKPWLVDRNEQQVNLDAQANAIEALFNEFWHEDWFAGGYVWKWFVSHKKSGGDDDNRFTPQNKPAQKIIAEYFKTF